MDTLSYPIFMTLESHPLHKEYLNAKLWMTSKTGDEFLAEVDRRVSAEGSTEKKTRIKCILKMVILASLYYDFFCANKVCANITNKLESIASVLGITTNEKKVFRFFNNGWYNVGDLDLDDFQSLFSRQKRETGNRDVKELSPMFVNVIIYTLGYYPGTAHTYPKAFNISSLNNTSSPGSTHRGHSDCGFQTTQDPKNPLQSGDIMGGNIQYRLILNTMIWAAYVWAFIADEAAAAERSGSWLAYALSSDGGDGTLKYGHRKSKTRSNFQAQKEYVYQRACTFFNFIYLNKVSSGGDVNSIYLMNLALDELWRRIDCSGSPSSHNSAFKSTFASSQEVVNFESQLSSVLDSATAAYESKKREILKL